MTTWYQYRDVWAAHPWMLFVAIGSLALLVAGVVGTALGSVLAVCFIPGLAALFGHHVLAGKFE